MSAKRRRLPFVGRPPSHGVSRHRRNIPLAESTQLNIVLTALYVLFAVVYLRSADGLFDGTGNVIGRDFINLWSAGTLSATGHLIDIFDYAAYHPLQEQLFGRELPPHNWSYPPHMLLIAALLAWLPYIWALALWSLLTLGAYLLATRRLALLIAHHIAHASIYVAAPEKGKAYARKARRMLLPLLKKRMSVDEAFQRGHEDGT